MLADVLPSELASDYASLRGDGVEPRFRLRMDIGHDGMYGDAYLVVDDEGTVLLEAGREPLVVAHGDVTSYRVDELFGASRFVAETDAGERHLGRCTRNLVGELSVLCRVAEDLREAREPLLPDELELAMCPKCGAPLPERGATCPLCLSRRGIFMRTVKQVRPYRTRAIVMIAATCIGVGCAMIPPITYKMIADRVIGEGQHDELLLWILVMLGAFLAEGGFRFAANWMNAWLGARVVADMRADLHARAQRLRVGYHDKHESGELVGRIMHDTGELQHFLIDGLPYFLINTISFISIACIMLWMDWRLALLVFLPVPILLVGGRIFWKHLRPMFHQHGNRIGALHTILGESLRGVRAIKSLGQEQRRSGEFGQASDRLFRISTTVDRTFQGFFSSMALFMAIGTVLVWYVGSRSIVGGSSDIQLGTLLAFVGYMALFYGPLQWWAAVFSWMSNAMTAAERIFAVIDQPVEGYRAPDAVVLERAKGRIRFEGVHFSYERGKEVLHGIDLDITPGEMIGLVGKSGAGKSTIINLVCRFHDPDSGRILVDGEDMRKLDLESWRKNIGIVMQEPFLFNASVLENIRYGAPHATFDDVVRAARAANAHGFICAKDEGYDTVVGDGGSALSGGERQRVAIARAILHDPAVLILDEATSAVDSQTEKRIQEAIANLVRGRTTIAIAHRLATLRNADRLVVIDGGRVVEEGSHEKLLAIEDGHFAKLVKLQTEINQLRAEQSAWQE